MRGSLKLTFGISLLGLLVLSVPACGDDDSGGGGTKATGGSGGSTGGSGGSTGGAAGSATGGSAGTATGGAAGSGGGSTCGGTACETYKVGGLISLPPCCSKNDKCGSDVSATVGALIGVAPGCYEIGQKGNDDSTCPQLLFTNPLDSGPAAFDGCCNHATSKCGYKVNITSSGGPDFGCIDATGLTDAPQTCTPMTSDGGGTDGGTDASTEGGSDASTD